MLLYVEKGTEKAAPLYKELTSSPLAKRSGGFTYNGKHAKLSGTQDKTASTLLKPPVHTI